MRGFAALLAEAVRDAIRRRIVIGIVAACLFSLMLLDSCTSCATGEVVVNGEARSLASLAGGLGVATLVVLGLWIVSLAGILAADHLRQALDDGSARMSLARPVGRGTFVMARLGGVLCIAYATGLLLLGAAAFLLATRNGLSIAPALGSGLACALACAVVASLAMAASLWLSRIATVLLVMVSVAAVAFANSAGLVREDLSGALGAIDRWGPPLATAMIAPLQVWLPELALQAEPLALLLRLLVWTALGAIALGLGFRRLEL